MDQAAFERLTRGLGEIGSRRAALAALASAGLFGAKAGAAAKKKGRRAVKAQATCSSPGPGTNLNGCDFTNEDFAEDDLHGSLMKATIFEDADLREADLHGSNAKGANFRDADLCGAELFSSTLTNADFSGANLRRADLHSSGCAGIVFTGPTKFCETILCDGTVDNSDCPADPLGEGVCCFDSECPANTVCNANRNVCCVPNNINIGSRSAAICCSGYKCTSGPETNECKGSALNCAT